MPLRICLSTANTLSYPQGGYLWVFINWALGFRACGCDIAWLDVVPPSMPAEAVKVATERLRNALRPFGLDTAVLVGHLTEEPTSLDDSIGSFDFLLTSDIIYPIDCAGEHGVRHCSTSIPASCKSHSQTVCIPIRARSLLHHRIDRNFSGPFSRCRQELAAHRSLCLPPGVADTSHTAGCRLDHDGSLVERIVDA